MGADYYDYILADATVVPPEHFDGLQRKGGRGCPTASWPIDSTRRIAERTPTAANWVCPRRGFVFCCFNQSYKIDPRDIRGLDAAPARGRRQRAVAEGQRPDRPRAIFVAKPSGSGIASERLIFAPGGRRASPTIWRGTAKPICSSTPCTTMPTPPRATRCGRACPLLTCLGATFAGRVAASLLRAVGLTGARDRLLGRLRGAGPQDRARSGLSWPRSRPSSNVTALHRRCSIPHASPAISRPLMLAMWRTHAARRAAGAFRRRARTGIRPLSADSAEEPLPARSLTAAA